MTLLTTGCGSAATKDAQPDASPSDQSEPFIIAMPSTWSFYPEANVEGAVTLSAGCILIGGFVAIWDSGTAWDESAQAVTFTDAADASVRVDEHFYGAGGAIPLDVMRRELGSEAANEMDRCLAESGATNAVFAYPER